MSQAGFSQVSGTRVLDATGQLLTSGTISFTPILDDGTVSAFQAGGSLHGQALGVSVYASVVNGSFSIQLADTSLTNPVNISYLVAVTDNVSGNVVLQGSGYRIQPTGTFWSFDGFVPTLTPQLGYILAKGDKGDTGSPGSFGPTIKTATQLGCTTDGTDCAPLINSFLANASATSPHVLLLDAPGLISVSGIVLSQNGYCSIIGMGDATGFHLLSGAYKDCIALGYVAANDPGGTAPAITAQNVLLRDFRIDGNRAGQHGNWQGLVDVRHQHRLLLQHPNRKHHCGTRIDLLDPPQQCGEGKCHRLSSHTLFLTMRRLQPPTQMESTSMVRQRTSSSPTVISGVATIQSL